MTNKEAIETLLLMQAQVEWEYPMEYAAAFNMAIGALKYVEFMKGVNNCTDCGWKKCPYKPVLGETVRYNCYQWRAKE